VAGNSGVGATVTVIPGSVADGTLELVWEEQPARIKIRTPMRKIIRYIFIATL
jgi:hypothetical protein